MSTASERILFMNNEKVFEKLENWGCDVTGAMERFLEDEELYLTCLQAVTEDSNFETLGEALREKNTEQAFNSSHTLKGVLLNMGLSPMFLLAEQIVEPLRKGTIENLMDSYEELLKAREYLKEICNDLVQAGY